MQRGAAEPRSIESDSVHESEPLRNRCGRGGAELLSIDVEVAPVTVDLDGASAEKPRVVAIDDPQISRPERRVFDPRHEHDSVARGLDEMLRGTGLFGRRRVPERGSVVSCLPDEARRGLEGEAQGPVEVRNEPYSGPVDLDGITRPIRLFARALEELLHGFERPSHRRVGRGERERLLPPDAFDR